jgi:hypothetical protein
MTNIYLDSKDTYRDYSARNQRPGRKVFSHLFSLFKTDTSYEGGRNDKELKFLKGTFTLLLKLWQLLGTIYYI